MPQDTFIDLVGQINAESLDLLVHNASIFSMDIESLCKNAGNNLVYTPAKFQSHQASFIVKKHVALWIPERIESVHFDKEDHTKINTNDVLRQKIDKMTATGKFIGLIPNIGQLSCINSRIMITPGLNYPETYHFVSY